LGHLDNVSLESTSFQKLLHDLVKRTITRNASSREQGLTLYYENFLGAKLRRASCANRISRTPSERSGTTSVCSKDGGAHHGRSLNASNRRPKPVWNLYGLHAALCSVDVEPAVSVHPLASALRPLTRPAARRVSYACIKSVAKQPDKSRLPPAHCWPPPTPCSVGDSPLECPHRARIEG
jgi:hypothetical protein